MRRFPFLALLCICVCGCGHSVQPQRQPAPAASAPVDSANRLTFDNVMKLHAGQTYARAVEVMGKPIEVTGIIGGKPIEVAADNAGMWLYWGKTHRQWEDDDSHASGVRAWFKNGLLQVIDTQRIAPSPQAKNSP